MLLRVCKEKSLLFCGPWRAGSCICFVRWLGGLVVAIFSEGPICRPSYFGPVLAGSTGTDAAPPRCL